VFEMPYGAFGQGDVEADGLRGRSWHQIGHTTKGGVADYSVASGKKEYMPQRTPAPYARNFSVSHATVAVPSCAVTS
jgi:hypothetical protein